MATFSDDFNRANADSVGNGWSQIELNNGDARIQSNSLNFPTGDAAVAYRANTGVGSSDVTVEFVIRWASLPSNSGAVSVKHDGSTRNAGNGLAIEVIPGTSTVKVTNSGVDVDSGSFTFSAATDYYVRWDIESDYSMRVYIRTTDNNFEASDLIFTVSAFTPTSSDNNWALGNRGNVFYDSFSVESPVLPAIAGGFIPISTSIF